MKVLMTADPAGGVWTFAVELVQGLRGRGVEVALATIGGKPSSAQRDAMERVGVTLIESDFPADWMPSGAEAAASVARWLVDLEDAVAPDLVHLNAFSIAAEDLRSPTLLTFHCCVASWWAAVKREALPADLEAYRRLVARSVRGADVVAAPTAAMLEDVQRLYGPIDRAIVIPNGRSSAAFSPSAKRPYVFAAGRLWDDAKNAAVLNEAAEALDWPIFTAGSTRHPLGHQVGFPRLSHLGSLSQGDLSHWLSHAGICAHPALYEPFGLCVLEAALCGCALLLGDIKSLRENWDGAAEFVDGRDAGAVRDALRRLINDEERRAALSHAARQRALKFAPQRTVATYLRHYQELAMRQGPVRGEFLAGPTMKGLAS